MSLLLHPSSDFGASLGVMKTNPLTALGYKITARIDKPDLFIPTHAWSNHHYNFQIDTIQLVGCRASQDANPTIYFSIVKHDVERQKRVRPQRNLLQKGLIAVSISAILLLLYPLYPAAQYQVKKKVAETVSHTNALAAAPIIVSTANRVVIPKIGVDTAILEGPNLTILNKKDGVWHETGTESNNLVLAGHRFKYLPPNTTTLYNLDKIQAGDTIIVDWNRKRNIYIVTETKIVSKRDIAIRNPTPTPTITIYSCEEKNQAHRIVVTAKRLD